MDAAITIGTIPLPMQLVCTPAIPLILATLERWRQATLPPSRYNSMQDQSSGRFIRFIAGRMGCAWASWQRDKKGEAKVAVSMHAIALR
eukprot:scaffold12702_cov119-Skeletonema_dohrnii-CCMP3373.AAC.3